MKVQLAWKAFLAFFSAFGAFMGWFLGGLDGLIYVLLTLAVCDYITGFVAAFTRKELSSEVGAKGIVKKVVMFTIVGVGHLIDAYMLGNGTALRTAVVFWYIANEGLSLIENAINLNVPVPKVLKDALIQIKKKSESDEDGNGENL